MWIVELTFTSEPERLAERAAHRSRLGVLHSEGTVRMAGPLADDSGAIIIIDAPDRSAVNALIAADPYFAAPGVRVAKIRNWQPFLQ
jgi:uncharacterized protein